MKRPADVDRAAVLDAVAPLLELLELDAGDVKSLRVGTGQVTARVVRRGRSGRIVPGIVETRTHRILPEPVED